MVSISVIPQHPQVYIVLRGQNHLFTCDNLLPSTGNQLIVEWTEACVPVFNDQ